ncbi:MAG TPA: PA domain-containing protein [Thermoanaerobaculia bacterium]|nr:PA domain-containing protein [Thermoanaerobaculia bacterium]
MRRIVVWSLLSLAVATAAQPSARITFINDDVPGEGLNDVTPVEPVGGNHGTTIGEQRRIALERAAQIWGDLLDSAVEIKISVGFRSLSCSDTGAVLASAGAESIYRNFANAPLSDVWYVSALASKLAGEDLDEGLRALSARFNGRLGNTGCAAFAGWYYGLDNNAAPGQIDLIVVALHEFAHGLGFSTVTDKGSGVFVGGLPDVYSNFLFDNTLGLAWPLMTNKQRAESATSTSGLTWAGPNVVAAAAAALGPASIFEIFSPQPLRGSYRIGFADFGGEITLAGVTARIAAAMDAENSEGPASTDACTAILNPAEIAGRIALVDRGECNFVVKAKNVQDAGALAAIIANNADGGPQGMGGNDPSIIIPVISVTKEDGAAIRAGLPEGVDAAIRQDPQRRAGTDTAGRPLLYAPPTLASGSSVSHWDRSAEPDLLMEPSISPDLTHDVDLTRHVFADLGWQAEAAMGLEVRHALLIDRDGDQAADPGDVVRITATIRNDNGLSGHAAVLDATIASGATLTGGTMPLQLGSLAPESERTVTFDVTIDPALPAATVSLPILVTVTATNLRPAEGAVAVTVSHTPLRAFKEVELMSDADASGTLSGGDVLRYRIRITNHSERAVADVRLEDTIDSHTTSADAPDGVVRAFFAVIEPGAAVEIAYDATLHPSLPAGLPAIVNQGTITAAGIESLRTDDPSTPALSDATKILFPAGRRRVVGR